MGITTSVVVSVSKGIIPTITPRPRYSIRNTTPVMPKKSAWYYQYRRRMRALEGNPIRDVRDRPGDRHRDGYHQDYNEGTRGKQPSKWERRHVVGWDGEGANLPSGEHVYNLLSNSQGHVLVDMKGLDTIEVFDFMLEHSREDDINVIYGGSYDVNMILRDLPRSRLEDLWKNGNTNWKDYRIFYANRKKFTIQLVEKGKVIKSFVLWDVIGYFQAPFVLACEKWLGDLPILKEIQKMKDQRSTFKSENIEDIIQYNRTECKLLVLLCESLFSSLDECDIKLQRYDGAGSIAAAMLRKNSIQKYKGKQPKLLTQVAQCGYSGGRIEAVKCGTTIKPTSIYRHDINSAYPSGALWLPDYTGATWEISDEWDGSTNSIVEVEWDFEYDEPFYPLWYRDDFGGISYPRAGRGWYWGAEIKNLYKYHGDDFQVLHAYNCTLASDYQPFHFIEDYYRMRREFKERESMASESLKLGLNSLYGKLVQQAGYREGRIPSYHQLLWGGQITANTRAKLYDVAMQAPADVISFATDAVFSTKRLDVDEGTGLGQWTVDTFQGMTIVQAGVYFLDRDGKWSDKYRGFDKGSLDREKIIQCWKDKTPYEATLTRFIGLGSALNSSDFGIWRTWRTEPRSLDIYPTGKRIAGSDKRYATGLRTTKPQPNITPGVLSRPYKIAWLDGVREGGTERVNGIPLEVLVDEYEDGNL